MIGIFGTSGIGKTTIAKAIYNSIASQFEGSCFLEDIREASSQMDGMIYLQNKLLSMILGGSSLMVSNVDQGTTLIKQRLRLKRILLVLDDVDQLVQLEKLAGKCDWFSLGSRIIITTKNKHLLTAHGVDLRYQVKELDHDKALQLFSWYAFNRDRPDCDYVEITREVVCYTGGLPLALIVLGSTLKGKNLHFWKSKLDMYKRIPPRDIQQKLRISFDGLEESAKIIFLDIACFFKGDNVEYVKKILDSRGFDSYGDIEELKDKCLITQSCCGLLMMHDLLQEMGKEIVRQESPEEPGQRSRLWFHEDIHHVLEKNTGTNKVEGIFINLPVQDQIHLSPKAFKKMKMLKMLINRNARFVEEPNFLSNELRLLDWPKYPGQFFPSNFHGKNLVVLRMQGSQLKGFKGVQNFPNMKIMNFCNCKFLRKIPDVSRIPNLEKLVLQGCKELVEVHHSVGLLNKLVVLDLNSCSNLRSFPRSFKLISLKILVLDGCSKLKNFPEIECPMECLEDIFLGHSGIEQLPSSFEYLVNVKTLNLSGCHMNLLNSIYQFQCLEKLDLSGCSKIDKFLKNVEDNKQPMPTIISIEESAISSGTELLQLLPLTNTSDSNDGCSSISFLNLESLSLNNCALTKLNFIRKFDWVSTLFELYLSENDIVTLPRCIESFVGLKLLFLNNCKRLREIIGLPPNVEEVYARECVSLVIFLEEARSSQSLNLRNNVPTESDFLIQRDCLFSLKYLSLSSSAIVSFPAWFNKFVRLRSLNLTGCNQLREIPKLPPSIENVDLHRCTSLEKLQFNNIYDLRMLKWIDLSDCPQHIRNDVQIDFFSERHLKKHPFGCIFPGNKIPDFFSHRKEVSNTNWCEVDINEPVRLDSEKTTFAFSAVFGTKTGIPDSKLDYPNHHVGFFVTIEVISDGVTKYNHIVKKYIPLRFHSDHVCLYYEVLRSFKLKGDNLRVKFELQRDSPAPLSVFFKSCGFHLEAVDLMDGVQLSKRPRDDDDLMDGVQQKKHCCG